MAGSGLPVLLWVVESTVCGSVACLDSFQLPCRAADLPGTAGAEIKDLSGFGNLYESYGYKLLKTERIYHFHRI